MALIQAGLAAAQLFGAPIPVELLQAAARDVVDAAERVEESVARRGRTRCAVCGHTAVTWGFPEGLALVSCRACGVLAAQ
jgi:ribosomal protein S27E